MSSPTEENKRAAYAAARERLSLLTAGETDEIALMATIACELHQAFEDFHWTGFYRNIGGILKVGPYQGGHGCLEIAFERGVCGRAATDKQTQLVEDVNALPYHIACSSSTRSEIVVPVLKNSGELLAVLDIDSDLPSAFTELDRLQLEELLQEINWG